MTAKNSAAKPYVLPYHSCRNISSPEDERASRKVYSGQAPASSVLGLEDDENVREYLVDLPGRARQSPTQVHQSIRKTLHDNVEQFCILNGGMVIVAHDVEVDDKAKTLKLIRPSIINGSQTQGELRRYFRDYVGNPPADPSIKYELIVTSDDSLIAEISISRNFQNDVRAISIIGARGQLDELEAAMQAAIPAVKLRKSESDLPSSDFIDTEKLVQVAFALMPANLLQDLGQSDSKVFTYNQKARCLKLFEALYEKRSGEGAEAYRCFLQIAPQAWTLYEQWKVHQGFQGTRLRALVRDGREIVEVPDGLVFPIISALSEFVSKKNGKWKYLVPSSFSDEELIETAIEAYQQIAFSKPHQMGTNRACYSSCARVTALHARFARDSA